MLSEDDLVAVIAAVAGAGGSCVDVGIGDDAAVLAGGIVASTDILVDGVHFDLGRHTVPDIGHRAAAASLSDMAAMGAEPLCLLAAFGLPEGFEDVGALAARIAEGRALAAVATAMLDLSDGIATDVGRLAAASGTGAVVELERLPRAPG